MKIKSYWLKGALISLGLYSLILIYSFIKAYWVSEACWSCLTILIFLDFPCLFYEFNSFCIPISALIYFFIGALIGLIVQKIKQR